MTGKAMFGAGRFWGVEARFREIPGVTDTAVGYAGGATRHPTYRDVCSNETGHAEVVEVTFDPERVDYCALVDEFFGLHDPTQVNRQGPDVGTQYRSIIFVHDDAQRAVAEQAKASLQASRRFKKPIATIIEPAKPFWPAEEYHQRYFEKRAAGSRVSGPAAILHGDPHVT